MEIRKLSWRCILALAWWLPLASQTISTEILGLVTDPTGAVIAGATVTARRVATGDVRTTRANDTGNYTFPLLDVGEREVTCTAPGFKTEVRRGIVLELQQKARISFQLQVGQQAERIEVTSTAPLLGTEDATLGAVVESRRVVELPLNGRNFAQLATLSPGLVFGISRMGSDGQGTLAPRPHVAPGAAVTPSWTVETWIAGSTLTPSSAPSATAAPARVFSWDLRVTATRAQRCSMRPPRRPGTSHSSRISA